MFRQLTNLHADPYWQMIRRLFRQGRNMTIGSGDRDLMADNDTVKTCLGARRVRAFGRLHQSVMVKGKFAERAAVRPLVEIPHHHRWHMKRVGINRGEQCANLLTPP